MPVAGEENTPKVFTEAEVAARVAEEVAGLKANQQELLKDVKRKTDALKNYEGVDVEEFKKLKAAAEEAEQKRLAAEGDWKSMETQLTKKYETQIEAERGEKTRLRTSMEKFLIDSAAATELAKHSDSPKVLLPHIRSQMKVVEQDGEFYARVVDANGNVRISTTGQGSAPMSLTELIEEIKQDKEFAPNFRGTGSSGGGATRSNAGGGGSPRSIPAGDNRAFLEHLDGIASGKVAVE